MIYRSDYPFDIFKLFLLVIVLPLMWLTVLITPLISSNFSCCSLYFLSCGGNQNGKSHDRKYNDQQEKFEDIKGVIRTVSHMRGNTMTHKNKRTNNEVIVFPAMWFTVLITPFISSNFSCW
jgi:hypothetical protein